MTVTITDCDQGSDAWFSARLGVPTASEFQTLIAKGRSGGESVGRRKYLLSKAGEILTGESAEQYGYSNGHMERGKIMEDEARNWYDFATDMTHPPPVRVGFIRNDELRCGCSPDAIIGDDGLLEVKTKLPHLQLEVLEAGVLPSEHKAQCQGALLVTGRQWISFVSYWPRLPPFHLVVKRDEAYIAVLKIAIQDFNSELDFLVSKYKAAA